MKVLPFKIPKSSTDTLIYQEDVGRIFYDKLHQHQEIQISYIEKGEGTYIIGDAIGSFKPHDFFIIGEKLPHVFKCDTKPCEQVKMISLFFSKDSFGKNFFNLPEFFEFQSLFEAFNRGILVRYKTVEIEALMQRAKSTSKIDRFIILLEILKHLYKLPYNPLSSIILYNQYSEDEGKRMDHIFQFVMNEFHRNITLKEVANIAYMTPNAFCRYFKQRTNKTFVNFLTEIRIGNACKLLTKNEDLTILDICFRSGFNNLSNFNRKFKQIKGVTPSNFRKTHHT
ncbi:hypothetical protein UJ101_02215 [Flavobacteriaceae bacterium UJ101]|nr:hypothetical protein UJ101_02215 [Flavobacteriaceae bacterium UJ101]